MQFNYFSIPVIAASLLMFTVGFMVKPYRSNPGLKYFALLMFAGAGYSLFYALEISSQEEFLMMTFYRLQYLVIPFIPAFFLIFAAGYTRKAELTSPVLLIIVLLVPVLTVLFATTFNLHAIFITEGHIDTTGPFPVFVFRPGPWYWVYQIYTAFSILSGIILFFRMYISSPPAFQKQLGIILAGSVIPFVIYLFYLAGVFPQGLDANPFSFAITGVIIFAGISRFKLFSLAPLARNMLFDSIPDGVIVLDRYFRLADMNRSAAGIFKIDLNELGRPSGEVFMEWPEIMANMTGSEKVRSFEISRITLNRALFLDCAFSPLFDEAMTEQGQLLIVRDVTGQRKAESDKHESEEKFRIIFENAPVGLMYFDRDGIVELCNNHFLMILGSDEEKVIGLDMRQVPDDRIQEALDKTLGGHRVIIAGEYTTQTGNRTVYVKAVFKPLFSGKKEVEGGLCIVEDISARKAAEEKIKTANEKLRQINSEKDRFFSILAHDLRSPFTAFLGYTELLEGSLDTIPVESVKTIASSMKESANNLYGLLENLLQWSGMQQGLVYFNPGEISVVERVLYCTEPLLVNANNKIIDVNYEIAPHLRIFADLKMFDTIIRNLFTNALKFTPKHGSIFISARNSANDHVDICFRDTGIGMSPEMVHNLFKLDVKTSRTGTDGELSTGLGLILVRELIEIHGGRIWVESVAGQGSSFFVRFRKSRPTGNTS